MQEDDIDISFAELFLCIQSGTLSNIIIIAEHLARCFLHKIFVGHSHNDAQFNAVEASHSVRGICVIFGSFIKFDVIVNNDEDKDEEDDYNKCVSSVTDLNKIKTTTYTCTHLHLIINDNK